MARDMIGKATVVNCSGCRATTLKSKARGGQEPALACSSSNADAETRADVALRVLQGSKNPTA